MFFSHLYFIKEKQKRHDWDWLAGRGGCRRAVRCSRSRGSASSAQSPSEYRLLAKWECAASTRRALSRLRSVSHLRRAAIGPDALPLWTSAPRIALTSQPSPASSDRLASRISGQDLLLQGVAGQSPPAAGAQHSRLEQLSSIGDEAEHVLVGCHSLVWLDNTLTVATFPSIDRVCGVSGRGARDARAKASVRCRARWQLAVV